MIFYSPFYHFVKRSVTSCLICPRTPTQVLLDKYGKEFFRHTGYYSAEEILKKNIKITFYFNQCRMFAT